MKKNIEKGTITYNVNELDTKTVEICKAYILDAWKRLKMTELAKTKKKTIENQLHNSGVFLAAQLMESVWLSTQTSKDREIELLMVEQ